MSLPKLAVSLAIMVFILLFTVNCATVSVATGAEFKNVTYSDISFMIPIDLPDFTQPPYEMTGSQAVFDMDHAGIYFAIPGIEDSAYFSILVTVEDPYVDDPQLIIVAMSRWVSGDNGEVQETFWVFHADGNPRQVADADAVWSWLFESEEV